MTADPGPILDYASPRQRGKLRLPSRSVLAVHVADDPRDPSVAVTEILSGKGSAIAAIAFAVLTLLLLGRVVIAEFIGNPAAPRAVDLTPGMLVIGLIWVSELTVMLMVINNTWRRTVLVARPEGVALDFLAPFSKRHYGWLAERVEEVRVVRTSEPSPLLTWGGQVPLGELELLAVGEPMVKLFTDHYEGELNPIAESIRRVLAEGRVVPGAVR